MMRQPGSAPAPSGDFLPLSPSVHPSRQRQIAAGPAAGATGAGSAASRLGKRKGAPAMTGANATAVGAPAPMSKKAKREAARAAAKEQKHGKTKVCVSGRGSGLMDWGFPCFACDIVHRFNNKKKLKTTPFQLTKAELRAAKKRAAAGDGAVDPVSDPTLRLARLARFDGQPSSNGPRGPRIDARHVRAMLASLPPGGEADWDRFTVKGTSTALEKRYLRLTSAPDPGTVRPPEVLERALPHVIGRWRAEGLDYIWICEQVKAIRQDLTVQRERGPLAVRVYEAHARIAIENGDLGEFNQCLSQLTALFAEGLGDPARVAEFTAYQILYYCINLDTFATDFADLYKDLSVGVAAGRGGGVTREAPAIDHALRVRAALAAGNHVAFHRLHAEAPGLGGILMDHVLWKVRLRAVRLLCGAFRPAVPMALVAAAIGAPGDEDAAITYCEERGAVFTAGGDLDTRASVAPFALEGLDKDLAEPPADAA
jgi:hypothetical protein